MIVKLNINTAMVNYGDEINPDAEIMNKIFDPDELFIEFPDMSPRVGEELRLKTMIIENFLENTTLKGDEFQEVTAQMLQILDKNIADNTEIILLSYSSGFRGKNRTRGPFVELFLEGDIYIFDSPNYRLYERREEDRIAHKKNDE